MAIKSTLTSITCMMSRIRPALYAGIAALLASCASFETEINFHHIGTVTDATGYPSLERVARPYIVGRQSVIYVRDAVTTDEEATVSLDLVSGTPLLLGHNTRVFFTGVSGGDQRYDIELSVTDGFFEVRGNENASHRYLINTTRAIVETSAERFAIVYSESRDTIDVVSLSDRDITISNRNGTVQLTGPLEATSVSAGSAPQAPSAWSSVRLDETRARFTRPALEQ